LISVSGLKGSEAAYSSQNGQPVDSWKCQATVSTVWASRVARAAAICSGVATSKTGGLSAAETVAMVGLRLGE